MSILEEIKEYPGTVPFFGYAASLEVDIEQEDWPDVDFGKDMIIKLTFPRGAKMMPNDVKEKAIKYFDGALIHEESQMIVIKADRKMICTTLLFAFREHYHRI